MKIEFKKSFAAVCIVVFALFAVCAAAYTSPSTNVGHDPSEVGPGNFGNGEGDYGFPNNLNIENSLTIGTGNLLFPTNARGIFWNNVYDPSKPHIDYSSTTGLWLSTGTTGLGINTEGGNLVIAQGKGITLGGETKTSWPRDVPAGFCVFSDTKSSCPTGWTQRINDGRTIRGATAGGATSTAPGGAGMDKIGMNIGDMSNGGGASRTHISSYTYDAGNIYGWTGRDTSNWITMTNWPPYINVIICCRDSTGEGVPQSQTGVGKDLAVGSGTIGNEEYVPLPTFSDSSSALIGQCNIMVSSQITGGITVGSNNGGRTQRVYAYVDSSGKVYTGVYDDYETNKASCPDYVRSIFGTTGYRCNKDVNTRANYLVICTK